MVYGVWTMIVDYLPNYTEELCSHTAILQPLFFIWSTLSAQIFLMLRIYALSGKNKIMLGGFASLTIIQALTGILLTAIPPSSIVIPPSIPLDVFHICVYNGKTRYQIAYVSMSLLYDTAAFISIVCLSLHGVGKISILVVTILQDATVYFLVIFISHTILAFFIIFARESLKATPATGSNILIPLMVTRLLLSLRKASDPETLTQWGMGHFTRPRTFSTVTTTGGHCTSDIPNFAAVHVSQFEVLDSVVELSDLGRQDEGHLRVSDSGSRDVAAV